MKTLLFATPVLAAIALSCASTQPSAQLAEARSTFKGVHASKANTYAPAQVMSAKQALDRAEKAHDEDAGSFREKSLAYIAQRQAETAAAYADIVEARKEQQLAEARYKQRQDRLRHLTEDRLEDTKTDLSAARRELATQETQIEQERGARLEAEKRAAAALESLREVATVKEEARGTVITLDGAVLFATGQSKLLPIARQKLNSVAEALQDGNPQRAVVIEGHTDSRGAEQSNLKLSQDRADSVRDYLVERGVENQRIRTVGRGEEQPVTSNDSVEGRANNRRVEIIISKAARSTEDRPKPGSRESKSAAPSPGSSEPSSPSAAAR